MAINLQILKLTTGEDILTEVTDQTIATVRFKNPVRIVVVPSKDPRSPSVGFAPWGEFSQNKEFVIDKSHVVCTMVPIQEFINQYNTMFGGIVAPSSKLIIPGA
jgi:hypothetical protein